jgi:hypothetical protein
MKIKDLKNIKQASDQIMEKLVLGKVAYFNILVDHGDGSLSQAMFYPITPVDVGKTTIFVDDYVKILLMLYTNPSLKDLDYDHKHNMITAIFSNPLAAKYQELENQGQEEFEP